MSDDQKKDLAAELDLTQKQVSEMSQEQIQRRREYLAEEMKAETVNSKRFGVGTRIHVGQTRGKASMVVTYEAFDESKPETMPKTVQEFTDAVNAVSDVKITKTDEFLPYLIAGYDAISYQAASDPLAEFVNSAWPSEAQAQFRLVVRNYARGVIIPIEDAVKLIKPGFDAQYKTS